jgi:hypothetical protein
MVAVPKSKVDRADDARAKRIRSLTGPLMERLGIAQQYVLSVGFVDKLGAAKEYTPGGSDREVAGVCDDNYPYRKIDITLLRWCVDSYEDGELVNLVLHEVFHPIIFGDMRRVASDQGLLRTKRGKQVWANMEENAVDLLALWVGRFWNEIREKEAKKRKRTAHPAGASG